MKKKSRTPDDDSSPSKFERKLIGAMKNERTRKRLMRIILPYIQAEVQKVLKHQSASSIPRSPINQIQAPDAIRPQLHFEKVSYSKLFTGSCIVPHINIAIRSGKSGEIISTGPLSSVSVELVVLQGDFEKEDWTEEEFKDNVVRPREGKGALLIRKEGKLAIALSNGVGTFRGIILTDNSSWTRSGKFRLGLTAVQGRDIQERIMEARTEAFPVREKRGESSDKRDCPSLWDKVWRLKNIKKNGVYCGKLKHKGIETVLQFLRAHNLHAPSLEALIGMKNKQWNETVEHAQKCEYDEPISGDQRYKYTCGESKDVLWLDFMYRLPYVTTEGNSHLKNPGSAKKLEDMKKQAFENWGQIVESDERPSFGSSNPPMQEAGIIPSNTDSNMHKKGQVMTSLPQQHGTDSSTFMANQCQQQENFIIMQSPPQATMFQNQNDTLGATNGFDCQSGLGNIDWESLDINSKELLLFSPPIENPANYTFSDPEWFSNQ